MKFNTRLWRRSEKSFATTIPQAILFMINPTKKYEVIWTYTPNSQKWSVDFVESDTKQENILFKTSLWKRSQSSFATTIPQAVLLHIDEEKSYETIWEFDQKLKKWTITLQEVTK